MRLFGGEGLIKRIVFSGPNMNTNTIRVHKFGRIRILHTASSVPLITTENSCLENHANTNTNIFNFELPLLQ